MLSSDHVQVFVFSPRVEFQFLVILKCKAFFPYDFGLFIRTFHPDFGIGISLIATALFKQTNNWAKQGMYQRFNLSQFQNTIKQPFKVDRMNTLCYVILGKKKVLICSSPASAVQCFSKKSKLGNFQETYQVEKWWESNTALQYSLSSAIALVCYFFK